MVALASLLDEQWSLDLLILLIVCKFYHFLLIVLIPYVLSVVVMGDVVDNVVDCVVDYGDISFRLRRKGS